MQPCLWVGVRFREGDLHSCTLLHQAAALTSLVTAAGQGAYPSVLHVAYQDACAHQVQQAGGQSCPQVPHACRLVSFVRYVAVAPADSLMLPEDS